MSTIEGPRTSPPSPPRRYPWVEGRLVSPDSSWECPNQSRLHDRTQTQFGTPLSLVTRPGWGILKIPPSSTRVGGDPCGGEVSGNLNLHTWTNT